MQDKIGKNLLLPLGVGYMGLKNYPTPKTQTVEIDYQKKWPLKVAYIYVLPAII